MIRTPLRPLARILHARATGGSPEAIERDNLRERNEALRERARGRAQLRLLFLCMCFFSAFTVVGARMGMLAASEPMEPRSAGATNNIAQGRADIVDRNGRVLATNMLTHALYAQTKDLIDPARAARMLPWQEETTNRRSVTQILSCWSALHASWRRSSRNWTPPPWSAALPMAAVSFGCAR